ncbi:hypothetical protein [Demequina sp. NBRC 110054]|uniref:hypothetical protein n=1 Tax=Demequina sp. NBRC 110054 TaxID=1570343 RepID=UPI0009FFD55A|nr:hypothetical protein [Demequina sp. NBRC 110054]
MSSAREAFSDLHDVAGRVFDTTDLRANPGPVEVRVARYRAGRTVLLSVGGLAVVGALLFGTTLRPAPAEVGPATEATPSTAASHGPAVMEGSGADAAACRPATVIAGKAAGGVGGVEGYWNSTPVRACEDWDQVILSHPETATINTTDGTMIEASYRTSMAALGDYADLGPDFVVPDPDPEWPAKSVIVIDVATGEILYERLLADFPQFDDAVEGTGVDPAAAQLEDPDFYKVEEPYPAGATEPTLADLWPRVDGATLLWENDTVARYLSDEAQPGEFSVVKGNAAVYAAMDWQCAWLREYLWGAQADDAQRVSEAQDALEGFSALRAIATYNPELGEAKDEQLLEPLREGDIDALARVVERDCNG